MAILDISKKITTEKGMYILIAVVGFISSIVTLFIDIKDSVSIRWLVLLVCLFLTISIILVRIIIEIAQSKRIIDSIKIVRYYNNRDLFLVKANFPVPFNSLLSIYIQMDGYEELYGIGYVENVQENDLLSVKVVKKFTEIQENQDFLKQTIIKTSLPYNRLGIEE